MGAIAVEVLSALGFLSLLYLAWKTIVWIHNRIREGQNSGGYDLPLMPVRSEGKRFSRMVGKGPPPRYLEGFADPILDGLLYRQAKHAARKCQRMWIRYKAPHKPETERIIEVYQADGPYSLFAWCCLEQEPRIFQRDRILAWYCMDERFQKDELLTHWAEEEYPYGPDAIPWNRWRQMKGHQVSRVENEFKT